MGVESGIGGGTAGLWYRVQAVSSHCLGGTAGSGYACGLPPVLNGARPRGPVIARRLSGGGDGVGAPTLFESALQTLMGRPFGWLIVADPTDLLDAETADLRNQLTVLRRYEDEHARFEADRAERRLGELDTYREAGLWN